MKRCLYAMLFGGCLFSAGAVRADIRILYYDDEAKGWATKGRSVAGSSVDAATHYAVNPGFGLRAQVNCGGGYITTAEADAGFNVLYCRTLSYTCESVSSRVMAHVEVLTPTAFRALWGLEAGEHFGIYRAADLTRPIVGPGSGPSPFETPEFVLQPGRYFVRIVLNRAPGSGVAWSWVEHLGDAIGCDVDASGGLNADDIDLFVSGFLSGALLMDLDGNGVLNLDDVEIFVNCFLAGGG